MQLSPQTFKRVAFVAFTALPASFAFMACAVHSADEWPTARAIRIVIPSPAGGPSDIVFRPLAAAMQAKLGQAVIIDNKSGANGNIGAAEVARAAPDGYTLLFSSLGLNVNPILLGEQAGYNPKTDFTPISNAATLPLVAVSAYDAAIKTMPELLKKARSKPDAVSFASSGSGGSGHLAGELLATLAKAKMLHVPYKGNGPALLEVMSGRVDYMFYPVIGIADNIAAKRVIILAVGTAKRLPQFPDTPTMAEAGFPGFEETAPWVGLLGPAKTPPAIVNRLNDAMLKALAKPDVRAQLEKLGAVIVGNSPAEFTAYLKRDYDRWENVIRTAAIKPEVN